MEYKILKSRQNSEIQRLKKLYAQGSFRKNENEYVLEGEKLLFEAVGEGIKIKSVFLHQKNSSIDIAECEKIFVLPEELFSYVSELKNSKGPIFTFEPKIQKTADKLNTVIVLENIQDPGNLGGIIRTAAGLGMDAVLLIGSCADYLSPKAARTSMGACFRQTVLETDLKSCLELISASNLRLYAAVLDSSALRLDEVKLERAALAIGNEGSGLSAELVNCADEKVYIPMERSESLNALAAASIFIWEMFKWRN
ncbi:MAG: TrmH family RNA methyltransferase [Candidatus Scatomorpha sp.]|jgi:TrmH family RNA methyltransferase